MAIKKGDKVKVEYVGTLDDGTVFDDSAKHGQPLEFEAGAGQVIPGFDDAVIGMSPGEEKSIHIPVEGAYGPHVEGLVKQIPRANLPKDQEPQVGMMMLLTLPDGQKFPAKVCAVDKESISIDLNHPLAGQALNFKIKIV